MNKSCGTSALRVSRLLIAAWLSLMCAHAAAADTSAKITRLMEVSGINFALKQILPGMLGGFDAAQQQQPLPANARAALRDAAIQSFQAAPMQDKLRAKLAGTLNEKQIDDTLVWLDTPLGRRITEMENTTNDPANTPKMLAYAEDLQKRPATGARVKQIQDLNRALHMSETMATITEATLLATALGFNAAQPRQMQAPQERIQKQIKANMPEIKKASEQHLILALLFTYRALTDAELDSYIKFAKSPSGEAYHKSTLAGMNEAMLEAIGRYMIAIPKAVERSKGAVGT